MGVNGFRSVGHDAATAILVDDRIIAAVEEERLIRVKRAHSRPPVRAIREVLDIASLTGAEVDLVTYPWLPSAMGMTDADVEEEVLSWFAEAGHPLRRHVRVRFVEHHLAHALSGIPFVPDGVCRRRLGMLVLDEAGERLEARATFTTAASSGDGR
jgi:carbamoyltransferase